MAEKHDLNAASIDDLEKIPDAHVLLADHDFSRRTTHTNCEYSPV